MKEITKRWFKFKVRDLETLLNLSIKNELRVTKPIKPFFTHFVDRSIHVKLQASNLVLIFSPLYFTFDKRSRLRRVLRGAFVPSVRVSTAATRSPPCVGFCELSELFMTSLVVCGCLWLEKWGRMHHSRQGSRNLFEYPLLIFFL